MLARARDYALCALRLLVSLCLGLPGWAPARLNCPMSVECLANVYVVLRLCVW